VKRVICGIDHGRVRTDICELDFEAYESENSPAAQGLSAVVVRPGGAREPRWIVSRFPPWTLIEEHSTPTVDYVVVLDGAIDLIIDGRTIPLVQGDSVVQHGAPHCWRTTSRGAVLSGLIIIAPSAEQAAAIFFNVDVDSDSVTCEDER
jgi:quercetin dioxygenase-like cupin family protein